MSHLKPKRFNVTLTEVHVHTATVTASNDRDAAELASEMWDDGGSRRFQTLSLGCTKLLITEEVRS